VLEVSHGTTLASVWATAGLRTPRAGDAAESGQAAGAAR
jgi:hypothetical protein